MRRPAVLLLAALALPAAAFGQFPGASPGSMGRARGMGRGGFGRGERNGAPAALPTNVEIEQRDPIVLLMQKRKELSLADSQFTKLTQIDASLMERNRPLLAALDSIRSSSSAVAGSDSAAGASGGGVDRRSFMGVYREIDRNNEAAVQEALGTLSDEQQKRASKLLEDQRRQIEKSMGGGRPRGLPGGERGERG